MSILQKGENAASSPELRVNQEASERKFHLTQHMAAGAQSKMRACKQRKKKGIYGRRERTYYTEYSQKRKVFFGEEGTLLTELSLFTRLLTRHRTV